MVEMASYVNNRNQIIYTDPDPGRLGHHECHPLGRRALAACGLIR